MREKSRKRIVGSDTPPGVPSKEKQVRIGPSTSGYKRDPSLDLGRKTNEKEKEKVRLNFVVTGADASGELTIAPTLWASWNAWTKQRIIRDGYALLQDAIYESARVLKEQWGYGSSVTTRRYVKEASSPGGDFVKIWNQNLGWILKPSKKWEKVLVDLQ